MEANTVYWVIGVLFALIALVTFTGKHKKVIGLNSGIVVILSIVIAFVMIGATGTFGESLNFLAVGAGGAGATAGAGSDTNLAVNPAATYATYEKLTSTSVGGTAYYQRNGDPATTTSIGNVNPGVSYTYWVSNGTTYVKPKVFVAGALNNNIVNKEAWTNASNTLILYDSLGNQNVQNSVNNVSMGAGATNAIALKYQGTFQKSAMPFGGVLVVEYNQTLAQVICTGDDVAASVPYSQVTYSVSSTANTYTSFGINPSIDDGTASVRTINCQFKNGASDTSSLVNFKFIPANYYLGNDGQIYLDVQKTANQDTARTGLSVPSVSMYFT